MQALGLGARLGISLPFSRVHEEEADIIGQAIMAQAGLAPQQSVAPWRNMAATDNEQPPEFLSTHPTHGSRTGALQQDMEEAMATYLPSLRLIVPASPLLWTRQLTVWPDNTQAEPRLHPRLHYYSEQGRIYTR